VKSTSRDRIIAETERVFILAGASDFDSGMAQYRKFLDWLNRHYQPMSSKTNFAAALDAMPEPSWLTMRFILGTLRYAPQLIRYGLKELSSRTEEDFGEIPRGRPGLDSYSKAQIVARIGKWHVAGYTLDQAKKRAAREFTTSETTIQRAWDDRGNREAVDFRSVLKFLASDEPLESKKLDSPDEAGT
jgi:hypothetical protein